MHIRRSVLAFILCGVVLFSSSLILWSRIAAVLPWPSEWTLSIHHDKQDAGSPDWGHSWPDPVPGDDYLRKHPPPPKEDDAAESSSTHGDARIIISSSLLRSRLQAFLDAPVQSHTAAITQNEKNCPRMFADRQVNPDQYRGNVDKWVSVNESEIRNRRLEIIRYLENLNKGGIVVMGGNNNATGQGRGIVMTAGNMDTAHTALVSLRMLRLEHKSNLPVEIFSFPGELRDKSIINEMQDLGAAHREISNVRKSSGAWKNFHLKAASIISSKFAEVLYLDSDNVPLRDPAYLFDEDSYKNSGRAVFWPDFNKDHPDNAIWRILGRPCNYSQWEVESGQILIDKRGNGGLNLAALHIAAHMQAGHEFWFSLSGGDKDTFRYAFWTVGAEYLAAPRWLSSLGASYDPDTIRRQGRFCGLVMLQYDIAKDERGSYLPLFVHANLLKHRGGAVSNSRRYFQTIKRLSHDEASDRSLDYVRVWVYQEGGMCVDIKLDIEEEDGTVGGQQIITEPFTEVYEGVFQGFEDKFLRQKGKVGGW